MAAGKECEDVAFVHDFEHGDRGLVDQTIPCIGIPVQIQLLRIGVVELLESRIEHGPLIELARRESIVWKNAPRCPPVHENVDAALLELRNEVVEPIEHFRIQVCRVVKLGIEDSRLQCMQPHHIHTAFHQSRGNDLGLLMRRKGRGPTKAYAPKLGSLAVGKEQVPVARLHKAVLSGRGVVQQAGHQVRRGDRIVPAERKREPVVLGRVPACFVGDYFLLGCPTQLNIVEPRLSLKALVAFPFAAAVPDDAYRAGSANGESQSDTMPQGRLGGFRRRQRLPADILHGEKRCECAIATHPGR